MVGRSARTIFRISTRPKTTTCLYISMQFFEVSFVNRESVPNGVRPVFPKSSEASEVPLTPSVDILNLHTLRRWWFNSHEDQLLITHTRFHTTAIKSIGYCWASEIGGSGYNKGTTPCYSGGNSSREYYGGVTLSSNSIYRCNRCGSPSCIYSVINWVDICNIFTLKPIMGNQVTLLMLRLVI